MDPADSENFRIVSYSEKNGANYYSGAGMNPKIVAYAEIDMKMIRIKVVNFTDENLSYNYNTDLFTIDTKTAQTYLLIKGERTKYPSEGQIIPNQSVQFMLELPADYWKSVGLADANTANPDYTESIWKGGNTLQIVKENIDFITVSLGSENSIVLKKIPEPPD
jgi:hypothetical protein